MAGQPSLPLFSRLQRYKTPQEGGYSGHTPKPDMDPRITYTILEQFWFDSDDGQSAITYYHGKLKFDGDDFVVDVSFMPFKNEDSAAQIFEKSKKVSHDRVMRPWFFTHDYYIRKHIVCYDRFTAFLPANSPSWLSQPQKSNVIPGLPNPTLQREIRELAMGLEHLHNNEVSHSALNSPLSYVWSNDKIKMINIDKSKSDFQSESEKQWKKCKLRNIKQFGTGLKYLLRSELVWSERDSFLRCFGLSVSLDRHLKMVYTHPFLMEHMKKILQLFADAHHAYMSQDGGDLRVDLLNLAFKENDLDQEYLSHGVGWNRQMGTEFTKIIQFVHTTPPLPQSSGGSSHPQLSSRPPPPPPPQSGSRRPQSARGTGGSPHPQLGNHAPGSYRPQSASGSRSASTSATALTTTTCQYKTTEVSDLLRFLRNVFEHYYENKMSLSAFYKEVKKHWPHFVDRIHEKVCL